MNSDFLSSSDNVPPKRPTPAMSSGSDADLNDHSSFYLNEYSYDSSTGELEKSQS